MEKKKEKKSFNKKKAALMAAAIIAAGGIGIGGASAYFSAQSKTVNNGFSVVAGKQNDDNGDDPSKGGALVLHETKWDTTDKNKDGIPDAAANLQPGDSVAKNPTIESNVSYPGYVVIKVSVPKIQAKLNASETAYGYYPAFTLQGVSDKFTLVKTDNADTKQPGTVDYYYALNDALGVHATTPELFTSIKEQNFVEVAGAKTGTGNTKYTDGSVDLKGAIVQTTDYKTPANKTDATSVKTFNELYAALNKK